MAEDDTQHIVEVMSNTASQTADRLHPLGLHELGLENGPFVFGLPPLKLRGGATGHLFQDRLGQIEGV